MIKTKDYTAYFKDDIKASIPTIKRVLVVAKEEQLSMKIKEITKDEIFLVVIIPSSDILAQNVNAVVNNRTCLLYVLKFYNTRDKVDADFENALEETEDVANLIKQKMIDDVDTETHGDCPHIMHSFLPNGMHIDPEYNYLGCNGWSLSFNLNTPGL